jgi:probable rRNA maturation factor
VQVVIHNRQKKLAISPSFIEKVVLTTLEDYEVASAQVVVHFVGKKRISDLHQQFFNDPSPTDCITFPIRNTECLGEVFVCPEVALEYAKASQGNPLHETALYVVHGLLHLLGYDDLTPSQIRKMRQLEKQAMQKLKLDF